MKEIGKLIELLNEAQNSGVGLFGHWVGNFERKYYAKNHWRLIIETLGYTDEDYEIYDYTNRDICGKDGGFIKWLVENDKINKDLISRVLIRAYVSPENHVSLECEFHDYYESLLMLLSIQDNPIDFLISILR